LPRGNAYYAKKDHAHAIADYGQAIGIDPKNADGFNGRCYNSAIVGQLQAALMDCNQSLALRPNDADTLDSGGITYLKLGQFDNAIADYNAALRANPRCQVRSMGAASPRPRWVTPMRAMPTSRRPRRSKPTWGTSWPRSG
jgi:tetratricopeptide (TPR) repeat protein